MNILKPTILALACTSLVACSSSGTDTAAVTASTTPAVTKSAAAFTSAFAKESTDTAEKALKSGTPLEAAGSTSVGLNHNFTEKKTTHANGKLVKIGANASGDIEIEVEGEKVAFTSADITNNNDYKKTLANGKVLYLWNQGPHDLSELTKGTEGQQYHKILGYYFHEDGAPDNRGFAVVGTETPADVVKELDMVATYKGWFSADFYTTEITNDEGSDGRSRVRGGLELTADFAKGTVNGKTTDVYGKKDGESEYKPIPEVAGPLGEAKIVGNGYSGKLVADANSSSDATYDGKFYGNAAQETAGTISGNDKNKEGEISRVLGTFSASKTTDN